MNIELTSTSLTGKAPAYSGATASTRETASPAKKTETKPAERSQDELKQDLEQAVQRLNEFVVPNQSTLSFSIDENSGMQVVKVVDSKTDEIIRQFPSEEAIQVARALDKLQGLLLKDKA